MSRLPRASKTKALKTLEFDDDDREELICPPPLRHRIGIGRGAPIPKECGDVQTSSSTAQPTGRGLLLFRKPQQISPGATNQRGDEIIPPDNAIFSNLNLDPFDSGDSGSDSDSVQEINPHSSDDSTEESDCSDDVENSTIGKDGTEWRMQSINVPSRRGPASTHNVFRQTAGLSAKAKRTIQHDELALSAFSLLVTEQMLRRIQKCTIAEAMRRTNNEWTLTLKELDAFIGILYARGLLGAKNLPVSELWEETWGNNIFKKTMARNRFTEILRYIRFDDKSSRSARLVENKFALFSEIWDLFNENCQGHYTPNENLSVDEQLFPTKARCRFTQFMPNKPDKFGIKFWIIAEVDSKYFLRGIPYLGKDELRTSSTLAHHVVLQLVESYLDKGYNVTADNFFTQLPLVLFLQERKTSYVGTIRCNRRELPQEALHVTKKPLYATHFYTEDHGVLLTSYKAKKNKNVLLLSTRHSVGSVSSNLIKRKPNTVLFYNDTKYGVDCLDQMCKASSVKSGVRRWPLAVFFNLLDIAAINAHILYNKALGTTISRRKYLKMLVEELIAAEKTEKVLPLEQQSVQSDKRRQCAYCRNKTFDLCAFCAKPICGSCVVERKVQNKCRNCM
jgi:hypothetical protein